METNKPEQCSVCKKDWTSLHVEASPGVNIYVCDACFTIAKNYFIWICMGCGSVHKRHKVTVINSLRDQGLKEAYSLCNNMQIIQGIDRCIHCDPRGILDFVEEQRARMDC